MDEIPANLQIGRLVRSQTRARLLRFFAKAASQTFTCPSTAGFHTVIVPRVLSRERVV